MLYLILGLIVLISVVLILVVLIQDSKGGALSGATGASQLMGVKRTGDILEKLTWGCAISIIVLTVTTGFVLDAGSEDTDAGSVNIRAAEGKKAPATPAPATPAPATPATPAEGGATQPATPAPAGK